jgi:anti-sigma factor RsiW
MTADVRPECAAVLRSISAYLDGELDAARCDDIEQHCATCADCAAVVAGLRSTIGLCRGAAAASLPDEVRRKAQESVRALLRSAQG